MLDFSKLLVQIESIGPESVIDLDDLRETLEHGQKAFEEAMERPQEFADKLRFNRETVLWPVATPLEETGTVRSTECRREGYSVVAVDGSQIMPSHHEVHACYVLNIGTAAITYSAGHAPLLENVPHLYASADDLYPMIDGRRLHVDESYVSLERTVLEVETLTRKAISMTQRDLPVLALYDGSLIPWTLERFSGSYRNQFVERMTIALNDLRRHKVPIIGYVSHSRSADIVNCLRVWVCPFEQSDCRSHCGHLSEDEFPCSTIWPLSDRQLLSGHLDSGECSTTFLSGAAVSRHFSKDDRICFLYFNAGDEIARLEFPRWVYASEEFPNALNLVRSDAAKGNGYPISLAEAHHLAVIKGVDRDRFFELMAKQLLTLGVGRVRTSVKEAKKRNTFV